MAWTAPMTAVASSVFTAAQFNTFIRDNLNECAPAKATGASSFIVTAGVNSIVERTPVTASIDTSESTTSTSFGDLTTPGPTLTAETGSRAIIILTCRFNNTTASQAGIMGYEISGATAVAASDDRALWHETNGVNEFNQSSMVDMYEGLNQGTHQFDAKYRVGGGTGTFHFRQLIVIPL